MNWGYRRYYSIIKYISKYKLYMQPRLDINIDQEYLPKVHIRHSAFLLESKGVLCPRPLSAWWRGASSSNFSIYLPANNIPYFLNPDYVHFQLEVIAMAVTLYIFNICTNVLSGRPEIQVYKSTHSQNWFLELEVGCFPYNTHVLMHWARFLKFCPKRPLTE